MRPSTPFLRALERACCSASSEMSVATARASGISLKQRDRDRARSGSKVGDRDLRREPAACFFKHRLDQCLGLRPRHQRRRVELELQPPELGLAEYPRDRLAVQTPFQIGIVVRLRNRRHRVAASRDQLRHVETGGGGEKKPRVARGVGIVADRQRDPTFEKRLAVGHAAPSNSESFFAWSSAISASTISSSASPSITLSSL